jgi:hypothetical protein
MWAAAAAGIHGCGRAASAARRDWSKKGVGRGDESDIGVGGRGINNNM